MKNRLVLFLVLTALAGAIAGCGGGDDGSSGPAGPAGMAPADSLVFLEVDRPGGKAAADLDALAEKVAGVDDLGELIVSELESSALDSGGKLDYAKEIEPWLGKKAGLFLREYDGDDFSEAGIAVETTNAEEAEGFLEKQDGSPAGEEDYEGVAYSVDAEDGSAIGVIDDFLAYGEDEQTFQAMVDASQGDSLADESSYARAISSAPREAVAEAFVDIGATVDAAGKGIDADARTGLKLLGVEPEGATAVASAIPGTDRIEIAFSSDVVADPPPAEDNSFLLGSMPADSALALASSGAGESLAQAIERLDREGLPDEDIKPGELKSVFKQGGVDLDSITSSITNVAAFAEGESEADLGGAAVLISNTAQQTVKELGDFLRAADVGDFTPIGGKVSGFSIRDPDFGSKPLVVLADTGIHLVVAYGLRAARNYFEFGRELGDTPMFKEAMESLEGIPISGFADGPRALRLALDLVSGDDRENLLDAKPYLSKVDYVAMGSENTADLAKSKLIVHIGG